MSHRAIPAVPVSAAEHGRVQFDNAIKANIDILFDEKADLAGKNTQLFDASVLTAHEGLVVPHSYGLGIRIDTGAPIFGWQDLYGVINIDPLAAANKPVFTTFRGGVKGYRYALNAQAYTEFHLPHDLAPHTDIFIHTHWAHNSASVTTGSATWTFEATHAKGHNQAPFVAPITTSVAQAASTMQYRHMITETQLSAQDGAGGLLVTQDLEPDSLILVRFALTANTIDAATDPFLFFCDIHYQSTGIATRQKAPNFYV